MQKVQKLKLMTLTDKFFFSSLKQEISLVALNVYFGVLNFAVDVYTLYFIAAFLSGGEEFRHRKCS